MLSDLEIKNLVRAALAEDIGSGDVTTLATVPAEALGRAVMVAREPLVLAGVALAEATFKDLAPALRIERLARDGQKLQANDALLKIEGLARPILTAERVALNFIQHLF